MASVKGFMMKKVSQPLGREGYGIIGDMYLNGKKIGTYADYGDGACPDEYYNSKEDRNEMMKVIIAFAKEHPNDFIENIYKERPQQYEGKAKQFKEKYPFIADEDITIRTMASDSICYILAEWEKLHEIEKIFKRVQKQGRVIYRDKTDGNLYSTPSIALAREKSNPNECYTSLADFDIA